VIPGLVLRDTVTAMTVATPLSVSGRFIVDARKNRVKLCGVNWAGAHQDDMTPGGLDYRHRDQIAEQIAAWGFNSVQLPFALSTVTATAPVPASLIAANRDLKGRTPWQVYQACVRALTGAGLMVIRNCHILFRGWCCSPSCPPPWARGPRRPGRPGRPRPDFSRHRRIPTPSAPLSS
jgi:endoglucanase